MGSLNANHRNTKFCFKKAKSQKFVNAYCDYIKLKGVWFSKKQNDVVASMIFASFIMGCVIGFIFGMLI